MQFLSLICQPHNDLSQLPLKPFLLLISQTFPALLTLQWMQTYNWPKFKVIQLTRNTYQRRALKIHITAYSVVFPCSPATSTVYYNVVMTFSMCCHSNNNCQRQRLKRQLSPVFLPLQRSLTGIFCMNIPGLLRWNLYFVWLNHCFISKKQISVIFLMLRANCS